MQVIEPESPIFFKLNFHYQSNIAMDNKLLIKQNKRIWEK
jgi:hypothetical protein